MPNVSIRHVTNRIAEVARKTAQQVNPILQGTVIGRNPDGSLIVDDGRGGCLRQAPRANVRIGQKIVLGTEPGLGGQTSLPLVTVTLSPSGLPCPSDPRFPDGCENLVGVPCAPAEEADFAKAADHYSITWFSANPLEAYPGTNGVWNDRLGESPDFLPAASHLLNSGLARWVWASSSRRAANYPSTFPGAAPFADRYAFEVKRSFLSFDTTDLPANAQILEATLQIPINGNSSGRIAVDVGSSLLVVPSTAPTSPTVFAFNLAGDFLTGSTDGPVLGEMALADIRDAGSHPFDATPYTVDIPLDPGLATLYFTPGGVTKLALVNSYDYLGLSYPVTPSFTNLSNPNEVRDINDFVLLGLPSGLLLTLRWSTGLID